MPGFQTQKEFSSWLIENRTRSGDNNQANLIKLILYQAFTLDCPLEDLLKRVGFFASLLTNEHSLVRLGGEKKGRFWGTQFVEINSTQFEGWLKKNSYHLHDITTFAVPKNDEESQEFLHLVFVGQDNRIRFVTSRAQPDSSVVAFDGKDLVSKCDPLLTTAPANISELKREQKKALLVGLREKLHVKARSLDKSIAACNVLLPEGKKVIAEQTDNEGMFWEALGSPAMKKVFEPLLGSRGADFFKSKEGVDVKKASGKILLLEAALKTAEERLEKRKAELTAALANGQDGPQRCVDLTGLQALYLAKKMPTLGKINNDIKPDIVEFFLKDEPSQLIDKLKAGVDKLSPLKRGKFFVSLAKKLHAYTRLSREEHLKLFISLSDELYQISQTVDDDKTLGLRQDEVFLSLIGTIKSLPGADAVQDSPLMQCWRGFLASFAKKGIFDFDENLKCQLDGWHQQALESELTRRYARLTSKQAYIFNVECKVALLRSTGTDVKVVDPDSLQKKIDIAKSCEMLDELLFTQRALKVHDERNALLREQCQQEADNLLPSLVSGLLSGRLSLGKTNFWELDSAAKNILCRVLALLFCPKADRNFDDSWRDFFGKGPQDPVLVRSDQLIAREKEAEKYEEFLHSKVDYELYGDIESQCYAIKRELFSQELAWHSEFEKLKAKYEEKGAQNSSDSPSAEPEKTASRGNGFFMGLFSESDQNCIRNFIENIAKEKSEEEKKRAECIAFLMNVWSFFQPHLDESTEIKPNEDETFRDFYERLCFRIDEAKKSIIKRYTKNIQSKSEFLTDLKNSFVVSDVDPHPQIKKYKNKRTTISWLVEKNKTYDSAIEKTLDKIRETLSQGCLDLKVQIKDLPNKEKIKAATGSLEKQKAIFNEFLQVSDSLEKSRLQRELERLSEKLASLKGQLSTQVASNFELSQALKEHRDAIYGKDGDEAFSIPTTSFQEISTDLSSVDEPSKEVLKKEIRECKEALQKEKMLEDELKKKEVSLKENSDCYRGRLRECKEKVGEVLKEIKNNCCCAYVGEENLFVVGKEVPLITQVSLQEGILKNLQQLSEKINLCQSVYDEMPQECKEDADVYEINFKEIPELHPLLKGIEAYQKNLKEHAVSALREKLYVPTAITGTEKNLQPGDAGQGRHDHADSVESIAGNVCVEETGSDSQEDFQLERQALPVSDFFPNNYRDAKKNHSIAALMLILLLTLLAIVAAAFLVTLLLQKGDIISTDLLNNALEALSFEALFGIFLLGSGFFGALAYIFYAPPALPIEDALNNSSDPDQPTPTLPL